MYESPINIIQDKLRLYAEGETYRAVQNVGIDVNKEELLKALQYDRGQYEKGYSDGYAKAISDFYDKVLNFEDYIEPEATNGSRLLYAGVDITDMVVKIAEEMRGVT